jgi:hypothetical protein
MLQPIITSGIKIKTTFDTSTPAITATMSPIPAAMVNFAMLGESPGSACV